MIKIGNALKSELEKVALAKGITQFARTAKPFAAKVVAEQPKQLSAIQRFLLSQRGSIKTSQLNG